MKILTLGVILLTFLLPGMQGQIFTQPEQVHISYGMSPDEMTITWTTLGKVNSSIVEYGTVKLDLVAKGNATKFVDGGAARRTIWIHRVTLKFLKPGQSYYYHVGSTYGWSQLFRFTAMKAGTDWSPKLLVFGDMGNENAKALGRIQEEAERGLVDAVMHVGDFAYDMDDKDGLVGDAFMNQIQSVAAYVPYMTCVGNHENAYNFSHYTNRFSMPGGDGKSLFYSFNIGAAHIVAFSTEFYYYVEWGWLQIVNQLRWLNKDLQEANKPENRSKRPWIIVIGHKPMYCSNLDHPDEQCNNIDNIVRVGLPAVKAYGLEEVFYKYGVDMQIYGHEHSYERIWPVYNRTVCNGTESAYTNPPAPVHIVTGSAGNKEGQTVFNPKPYPWSAFRTDDFGYTRLQILNRTHLYLEQVSDDKGGAVIDNMWLKKDNPYPKFNCNS